MEFDSSLCGRALPYRAQLVLTPSWATLSWSFWVTVGAGRGAHSWLLAQTGTQCPPALDTCALPQRTERCSAKLLPEIIRKLVTPSLSSSSGRSSSRAVDRALCLCS